MTLSDALTSAELAVLRHPSIPHSVKPYLSVVPHQIIAAAQINQTTFEERVPSLTIDSTSGDWSKAKAGMTLWVGTTAGAFDVGIYRVRGALSGNTLPIEEINSGDPGLASMLRTRALADDLHLSLLKDVNLHGIKPRIVFTGSGQGTIFKDYDRAYTSQNENAPPCWVNIGSHRAGWVDAGTDVLTESFTATAIPFLGETVLSYFWEIYHDSDTGGIGAIVTGTAASQAITVEFDPGHYLVWCTVSLSSGAVMRVCRHVFAHKRGVYEPYRVNVSSIRKTRQGTSVSLTLDPQTRLAATPILSGTMCILWEETRWSGDVPSTLTRAPLWLQTASAVSTPRRLVTTTFELKSTADIVAVSQLLDSATPPTHWQQAVPALMHLEFWCFYLLYYHSTALMLHDVSFQDVREYTFTAISEAPGSLFDQVQRGLQRLNMEFNQRHDGTLIFTRNPLIESSGDRNARPERMTLTGQDVTQVDLSRVNRARVDKVELYGFIAGGTPVAARTMAYGATGGQGLNQPRYQDQLVLSQAELNERAGMIFSLNNQPYDRIALRLARNWAAVIEPAEMYWVRVNLPADLWPEGSEFNQRCLVKEVTKTFRTNGAIDTALIIEPESLGTSGRTMPIHLGNGEDDVPVDIVFDDNGLPELDGDPFDDWNWSPWPPDDIGVDSDPPPPSSEESIALAWGGQGAFKASNFASPVWTEFFNESEDVQSAAYDGTSPFLSDPLTALYLWILTSAGLYYSADVLAIAPVFSLKQALTDGLLLRSPGSDKILIHSSEAATNGTWSKTFDFTMLDTLLPWHVFSADEEPYSRLTLLSGTWGVLNETFGVDAAVGEASAGFSKRIDILFPCEVFTLTKFSAVFDFEGGINDPIVNLRYNRSLILEQVISPPTASDQTIEWTGTQAGVNEVRFMAQTSFSSESELLADSGSARLKFITIEGVGFNPFEDKKIAVYSANTGTTISTSTFGQRGSDDAMDADDFNLGVVIATAEARLFSSTGYGDDSFDVIRFIPFRLPLNGIRPTVIRVPYRKLATQALNNNKNSLQFIYGVDGAIENPAEDDREETLWGVNFDAETRDPESIVISNMTPVIGETTYYVVGANALETAGANTQHILAFCKPVGGGATKLLRTTNGGTTWVIVNDFDGDFVRWIPGSTTRAWVSGADGVGYTENAGTTIADKTGDLAVTPRGVFSL